jgi:LPS-assembly protein
MLHFLGLLFFFLTLFIVPLQAKEHENKKENNSTKTIEIFATKVESNKSITTADGDVIVIYKDQLLSATSLRYNREMKILELFDNIRILKGSEFHAIGSYVKIDIAKEERHITPLFLEDHTSMVWMSSQEANSKKEKFELQSGVVSGCNPNNPLWTIHFTSSHYNQKDKWVDLYNARLHLYNIPVFYFPYFGYSMDTSRRSGFLMPSMGISGDEGVFYEQPLYIAIADSWDLELRPQVRTQRGAGVYGNLRFVDSKVSQGSLKFGYFKEKESYTKQYDLANQHHYGVELDYKNLDWMDEWLGIQSDAQTALNIDFSWMNDVDYLNLSSSDQTKNVTSNQVFSRANIFYNTEKNYVGAYFKYFLDLNKEDNSDTLQNLPTLQYHHYLETFFDDYVMFNFDMNFQNFARQKGVKAKQASINLPLSLQTSLFDNYLDFSYTLHNFIRTTNSENEVSQKQSTSGVFARFYNIVNLSSSLTKAYGENVHNISFGVEYTKSGADIKSGHYEDIENECATITTSNSDICEFYKLNNITESTDLKFTQFLFDADGLQKVYHKLAQGISFDNNNQEFGELENEFEYFFTSEFSVYNDTIYNYDLNEVSKSLNSIVYDNDIFEVQLNHLFLNTNITQTKEKSNYIIFDAQYRYNKHYKYFTNYTYEYETNVKKSAEVGFLYTKRCWDFGLRYFENNRPILTSSGITNSLYDRYVYATIIFKPIGGSEFSYRFDNSQEN